MRGLLRGAVLLPALTAAPASAQTASNQAWPERPIRFIGVQPE